MIEVKIDDICRTPDYLGHAITYKGNFDPKKSYSLGDLVIKDGIYQMIFDGRSWQSIDGVKSEMDNTNKPLKCKCCGAPLSYHNGKSLKCFYCGTEYGRRQ